MCDHKREALCRRRVDLALYPQEAGRLLHPLAEPPRHVREGSDDEVADAVVGEITLPLEAVVEDLGKLLAPGEGYQAVPHVAWRRHPELLPQTPARAPVVCDGYDGGKVADPLLEAPQEHRQTSSAAKCHNP